MSSLVTVMDSIEALLQSHPGGYVYIQCAHRDGPQGCENNSFTIPGRFLIYSFNRFMLRGTIPGAGDLVINKWAMVYNLMELTHKLFCFKILYIQRYLCNDHMTTVCHSINLSDKTWICKNLVLKLLDLKEEGTLNIGSKR